MEPAYFRKLPKRMSPKGIWDEPNFLSEEVVRYMKDISMSLADSGLSTKSSAVLNQSSGQSLNGCLHSSFWWFPFILFDTDQMGREIYGSDPNGGLTYEAGVRMGALRLLLNSVVLGITSLLMERLCRKPGAGLVLGVSNILMADCFLAILVVTYVANNIGYVGKDLPPPTGIVIVALIIFTILGFPLAITYSVPYALISSNIEPLGLGQWLSMGVLNVRGKWTMGLAI